MWPHRTLNRVAGVVVIVALAASACAPAAAPLPQPVAPAPLPSPPVPASAAPAPAPVVTAAPRPAATAAPAMPAQRPPEAGPRRGSDYVSRSGSNPGFFDPIYLTAPIDAQLIAPAFNALLESDPVDLAKITPELAENWKVSDDGKTYSFRLRPGVKWHDGVPFTSADVQYTFDTVLNPSKQGLISPLKSWVPAVDKVETPDSMTVVLKTKHPSASLADMLTTIKIVPKHYHEKEAPVKTKVGMPGTGPFKLVSYNRDVSMKFVRNPDYFKKGLPYLDTLTQQIILDKTAFLAAFRTGRVHDTGTWPTLTGDDQKQTQREMPKVQIQVIPKANIRDIQFQLKTKPFDDVRVRRAISLAFDRQHYIDTVLGGMGTVGGLMYPGPFALPKTELANYPGYGPDISARQTEAKKLLAEAGYGAGLSFKAFTRPDSPMIDGALMVKDHLKKVGIDVTIETLDAPTLVTMRTERRFNILIFGMTWPGADPDLIYGDYVTGEGRNQFYYSNPKFDELYQKQSRILDFQERRKIVWEMENIVLMDVPRVMMNWQTMLFFTQSEVQGLIAADSNWHATYKYEGVWLKK